MYFFIGVRSHFRFCFNKRLWSSSSNKYLPVSKLYIIEPRLKMSALKEYGSPRRTSGAIYVGVPHFSLINCPGFSFFARPKSAILISSTPSSLEFSRIFANFRSLCTMYFECMKSIASNNYSIMVCISCSLKNWRLHTKSCRVPPSWYSSTR